jgi:hypothetical protein
MWFDWQKEGAIWYASNGLACHSHSHDLLSTFVSVYERKADRIMGPLSISDTVPSRHRVHWHLVYRRERFVIE